MKVIGLRWGASGARRARNLLALAAVVTLGWPSVAAAQDNTCARAGCHEDVAVDERHAKEEVSCAECHPNVKGDEHPDALSEFGPEQICAQAGCHPNTETQVLAGSHKDGTCDQCHGFVHDEFKRFDVTVCRGCHKDAVTTFTESVHGKEVVCAECHGDVHNPLSHEDPLAPMSKAMQIETCTECHDKKEVRAFRDGVHGRAVLRSGLDVAPTCATCHGSHDIKPVKDPASPVRRTQVPETCGSCHKFILSAWKDSIHAELIKKGDEKAPVCTNCHETHGIVDLFIAENRLKMPEQCGECHEEEHDSYRESFHGKATKLGLGVAATCSDCHTPHKMLKADNPKSSVHGDNLEQTCENCHGDVNASFLKFGPHVNPANKDDDPRVFWVWLFMTGLLVGTLAFFALHTLLWLQRSVVGFIRKELHPEVKDGDQWVRRFRPIHIWIHVTIILTFLALSFTGLPIKFASEPWAVALANVVGGPGAARWLHRFAGVITFGYGAVFLGYLIREIVGRKRRELLWGWKSMVPNKKDLVDLFHNLRWFLYLGPRPKLDRWAYWEKFDFFAVFWGIPVIGFSGLMMWFPKIVTLILPGWVLNVAYVVHSDEALLATGFIFFFHFFHTHLRPEAFPLDPVVFTGSVPLERFKHERPTEYERLVQSGELQSYLVPPPTERTRTLVALFGFTALGIGVLLGVALMITGLHALFGKFW